MPDWITTAEQRAGLLVAVVTGGRPLLEQRPTARLLDDLRTAGFAGPVWCVSDADAPGYERGPADELLVYPKAWALDYARKHWMLPEPPDPDGFVGAFPGREWACREAERRGCWGVLQIDDNIKRLTFMRGTKAGAELVRSNGGVALFADILAGLALSTNAAMMGAQLGAVVPSVKEASVLVRPGFPYSLFVEKTGPDRESWFGPYEDDITHAFQYGDRADGSTAAVTPTVTYEKESKSKTGMRAKYDSTRAVQLQRLMPQGANIGVRATRSNGRGGPRVFHTMRAGAIRNPVVVRDADLYGRVKARIEGLRSDWYRLELVANKAKVRERTARQARKVAT